MSEISQLLEAAATGDTTSAERLLPLVYGELRAMAAAQLQNEKPGQTLQPTALVHEAYLRLIGPNDQIHNRAHFFGAAAEAMRQVLIENARRKGRQKRGGQWNRLNLGQIDIAADAPPDDLLDLDEAITALAAEAPPKAELVKLRYFAGLSIEEAAECLQISRATAVRWWAYARTWLFNRLKQAQEK